MIKQIAYLKPLLFLLALCLYCQNLSAQQAATVKSFIQTTDHIPVGDRRNDLNGTPCALVKVQVVDDIERVEGNKIGDIINHGVEKWVYMCKGSRNMRIHFKNHLPVRVTFRDYKINGLESNRVYELVVNTPNQPGPAPVQVQGHNLQMRVSPSNATITIWGDNYQRQSHRPQDDGTLRVYLPYGRYHYLAKADGYNDMEGSVFVNDENKWEQINMDAITGTLVVHCLTKNTDFFINGQLLKKDKKASSWTGQLVPGQYNVEARKKGYITKEQNVIIAANQTSTVNLEQLMSLSEQKRIEYNKNKQAIKIEKEKLKAEKLAAKESEKQAKADKAQAISQPKQIEQPKQKKASPTDEKVLVFGIRAGANISSLGLNSDADGDCSMAISFHAGLNADIRLMNPLHLNVSLLFSQKGYKYEHDWDDERQETATAQFIMLPVQLSYRIGALQINAGPYLDYGIGGTIEYGRYEREHDTFDYYDSLNYGITAGLGLQLGKSFYLGANYEIGLSDYANRNIAISLGFNF